MLIASTLLVRPTHRLFEESTDVFVPHRLTLSDGQSPIMGCSLREHNHLLITLMLSVSVCYNMAKRALSTCAREQGST